ncbi:MAG: DUF4386 domain-containing protein [Acidobacteriota bacterium]
MRTGQTPGREGHTDLLASSQERRMSLQKTARFAGLLYFLACIPAPFSLLYVPRALIVTGDPAATASKILGSEWMFRLGVAGELVNAVAFLFVTLALYRLFRGVDQPKASLMVTLFALSVPVSFVNALNNIAALILFRGGDYLSAFSKPQRDALAMIFLRLHAHGLVVGAIFWGLWLFPFGVLVYRSRFLPRILGVLLVINCFAYVIPGFTSVLLPRYREAVNGVALPFLLGELAIALWLLIRGARERPPAEAPA